jgi:hypothetical protein
MGAGISRCPFIKLTVDRCGHQDRRGDLPRAKLANELHSFPALGWVLGFDLGLNSTRIALQ